MFSLMEILWLSMLVIFTLFFSAVLFELYLRRKAQKKRILEIAHPARIEFALHHIRHNKIKEITNDIWEEITGVSHASATRDLAVLVNMGMLKKQGRGRGVHYTFVKHEK